MQCSPKKTDTNTEVNKAIQSRGDTPRDKRSVPKYKIGIDAGAYSIQLAILSDKKEILYQAECPHNKKIKVTTVNMIKEAAEKLPALTEERALVCAVGSMAHLLNLPPEAVVSEQAALIETIELFEPHAASTILIGAQKTMYVFRPDGVHFEIKKNSNCSAGTGAFFEEQASRIQISIEDISAVVAEARSVPNIAGRCSVFSKTDMIHRMQEGLPTADILMGLCYALVRNFKSSILGNKKPGLPVFLAGGVMKNSGVIEALKKLLSLNDEDMILDENSAFHGALGAALMADRYGECMDTCALEKKITGKTSVEDENGLPPLSGFITDADSPEFITAQYIPGEDTYLGIDVGSTSINLVMLNQKQEVVYYSYVKTLGRPLDIVRTEIEKMQSALPELKTYRICVTGSGREYIGHEIEADLVINEITAQTQGALISHPDTETVFEIGGQDSKYMSCRGGKMTDFEMNKVCAAGTGAFLEEQIAKLGISMADFTQYALQAEHPCRLGNRCTVFIEGSVNQALASGHSMEDVCAGLAYAIASNYLYRVVNRKPIGENIAIQGGIAYNRAVVCAFRAITGKQVRVSPYFSVTGAMGAASLLMHQSRLAFDAEKNRRLNRILLEKSEESYLRDYKKPELNGKKKIVGIPRVVFLHKMFPLFNGLFSNLGFDVLLSPLSNEDIIKKAQQYCTAETCYPIKLIYGHIAWLLEEGAEMIVLPRLYTIKHEGSVARKDYACMYMQTSPLLMEQAFHFKERGVKLIMPELSLQFGKKFMLGSILSIGPQIGIPKVRMLPAAASAFSKLIAHTERLEAIGKESLEGDEPIFVLVSRVYNIIDPVLNMGIEEHLNAVGCRVIHLEHLEASVMHVEHDYPDLYWPFGQHILTGLKLIKAHKNMYPIYITNHGCGPDTAIQHFFQNEMQGREYLQLEVDEHTSKVGVITRLEAFLYSLQKQEAVGNEDIHYGPGGCHGCTSCADSGKKLDLTHFDSVLIPDYGIYSEIIEKYIAKELLAENDAKKPEIVRVLPLAEHRVFNYAMNKEYYSMLIMLEELLGAVQKGKSYVMTAPIDEGSEVFGQYALLCTQELVRRGYNVTLRAFYLEDIIKSEDNEEIYRDMLTAEMHYHEETNAKSADRRLFVMGEPMCVYKPYIFGRNIKAAENSRIAVMPLSEYLLFHMREIDRKHQYERPLAKWQGMHDEMMRVDGGAELYTPIDTLKKAAAGRFDFCIGNGGKYRFAKLLSLHSENTDAAVLLNSSEENTAIILKQLTDTYRAEISVPFIQLDLDYEHSAVKEDFELI